ncbi:protogenin B [Alosa sapidissima]|uniref:protogenin B n=1 Tax=Alosa sapidissima TaxID=34773 RepID=UPI001C09EC51|nr:protogenin B [Alosa sapidissima]
MAFIKRELIQRMLFLSLFLPLTGVLCFSELSFVTEPCDVAAVQNARVVLDCQAQGEPPIDIRWLRNRVLVRESEQVRLLANGSLLISRVEGRRRGLSDEGFYHCLARNKYGAILSQRAQLTIASVPSFVTQPAPVTVREGAVARLTCDVISSPPATVTWKLNQRMLPAEPDRITVLPNGALQISDVRPEDAGNYRCLATNIAGRLLSDEATLSVRSGEGPGPRAVVGPEIVVAPQNISAPQHRTAVLECVAYGNPRPLVSWSRADSTPIDVFNARVHGNGNLVISDVQPRHSGVYLCRATTPRTRNFTSAAANLTVLMPPSLVERPESQTHPRAGTARFTCRAEGVPHPRITWLKNGQELHSNGRVKMYNSGSKLVITQITPEDDAMYQCVAENSQGSLLAVARLVVVMSEDRPSAPRNVRAETISSSAILLAWERPQYNADKVIAYSVHYTKVEGLNNEEYQAVIGNDTTSYIVDELEAAGNYSFYIVAYMPMGASRMSEPVCRHTLEDVPLRTPELSLTSLSPTDTLVSWRPLSVKVSRGCILSYRLSFRTAPDDQVTVLELPGDNVTQHLLQDLQPDTIYLVRIAAATRVGWSQPSAWSSHRTPKTSSSTVPLAPVLQLHSINCTSISVRWHPSPGSAVALGYRLFYHEEGQPEGGSHQLPAEDQQYTITGLGPREKYHVKLLAFSQNGDGYQADQTVSTPGCPSAPTRRVATVPPPDHLTAQSHNSSGVLLRWRRPAFASVRLLNYTVRVSPVGPQNASTVHYTHTSNQSLLVSGLKPNTRYEFAVRLHLDQGSSSWSPAVYQKTLPAAPQHPPESIRVLLIEERTALVSWREPEQEGVVVGHYTLLYASHAAWLAGEWQILQREGTNTMALLENLEPGNIYLIKISASNQVGDGPFSSAVELSVPSHQGKMPRHTHARSKPTDLSDGLYSIDQRSMTGIVAGVCIALACIVLCVFILIIKSRVRKSALDKPARRHSGDTVISPADGQPESAEVLVPMMGNHFIDSKGGTNLVINAAGPVITVGQSKGRKWSFFIKEQNHRSRKEKPHTRGCVYKAGTTLLRYEEELTVANQQPVCLRLSCGPLGDSESSHTSDGSRETGDSGHYSHEESSESADTSPPGPGAQEQQECLTEEMSGECVSEELSGESLSEEMSGVCVSKEMSGVCVSEEMSGVCVSEEMSGVCVSKEMCCTVSMDSTEGTSCASTVFQQRAVVVHAGSSCHGPPPSTPPQHC